MGSSKLLWQLGALTLIVLLFFIGPFLLQAYITADAKDNKGNPGALSPSFKPPSTPNPGISPSGSDPYTPLPSR